jgi:hypothetical protein
MGWSLLRPPTVSTLPATPLHDAAFFWQTPKPDWNREPEMAAATLGRLEAMSIAVQRCACGCDEPVKPGRRYVWGHSGHKFTARTGRAARVRVRSRRVARVANPVPQDAAALTRLARPGLVAARSAFDPGTFRCLVLAARASSPASYTRSTLPRKWMHR